MNETDNLGDVELALHEVLAGDLSPEAVDRLAIELADRPELDKEVLSEVAVHNLLCQYFSRKREEAGLPPTEKGPCPLDLTIVRNEIESGQRRPGPSASLS